MRERRWSGAFRVCPACAKRNFVRRSRCTACGVLLGRPATAPPATMAAPYIGRRGSERFQGRGLAAAGAAAVLIALAGGLMLHRLLRDPRSASVPVVTRHPIGQSTPATAPLEVPVLRQDDGALYARGRRLLAAGDAKGALRPLAEVVRRYPRDHAVVHDYGVALVRAGVEDLGIFQLEHASRLAPGIGSYRLDLIRALLAAGRAGLAQRELRALLDRDPASMEAAVLLASVTDGPSVASNADAPGDPSRTELGGATNRAASHRPADGRTAFTNDDLGRRRSVPALAKVPLHETVSPGVGPHAAPASPRPPG